MIKDELGDRMKSHEMVETARRLDFSLPIYARIDGRGFSKFTKGMDRPYDQRMTDAMVEVTRYLVEKTHATIGYVQSDEISLLWQTPNEESEGFFSGKVQKMVSVLASMAAAKMAVEVRDWEPFCDRLPHFDARVIDLPTKTEAANMMLWRANDAKKNATSMACRAYFSAREMHNKNQEDMIKMMAEKGVDFFDFPHQFRHGTYLRRVSEYRTLTEEERLRIPENHRPDANTMFVRSAVKEIEVPPFYSVKNRVEFLFNGVQPIV